MADKPQMLHTKAEITKSEEDGVVDAIVASTAVLDRQGDIIDQNGWTTKNFMKNPVILWGHNVREERPPIGKAIKVWFEGEGKKRQLMFKAQFDMADQFAAEIFRKIKEGFINMVSVGFLPEEWEPIDKNEPSPFSGQRFTKQDLLEISFVPVPANPQAAVQIRSLNVEPIEEDKLYPQVKDIVPQEKPLPKGAIGFKAGETVPEQTEWDGPGEVSKASIEDLKVMCTWFDTDNDTVKSSYKLPHHRAEDHKVVWRGVASSMALLLGAQGGISIPEEDRQAVYDHLAKHYKQFEKEVPEFRFVEEQVLKGLDEEIGALILDREDKYTVRLIKKVIVMLKRAEKKEHAPTVLDFLTAIDKKLETKLSKGGEI